MIYVLDKMVNIYKLVNQTKKRYINKTYEYIVIRTHEKGVTIYDLNYHAIAEMFHTTETSTMILAYPEYDYLNSNDKELLHSDILGAAVDLRCMDPDEKFQYCTMFPINELHSLSEHNTRTHKVAFTLHVCNYHLDISTEYVVQCLQKLENRLLYEAQN